MSMQQAINLVQKTFESSFDKSNFIIFIKDLLNHIEDAPFIRQGNYIPDQFKPYISQYERIGKYTDSEGHRLDILIVNQKKEASVEHARSRQRNFVAGYLQGKYGTDSPKDAALVAFVSPSTDDWRFSLVRMEYKLEETARGGMKTIEEYSPARRWSFLVGKNEKSHTAQSRLAPIIADDEHNPTLSELEHAFNIETVTKEFFEKYRGLFIWTKEELDRVVNTDSIVRTEFEKKNINSVDLAKKLLGQITFLYYLQKKGWFGVPRNAEWGEGSKNFLRELFEGRHGLYNNFFNDILEPLFFEALRLDRSYDDHYYSRFNCKIPFLNGGLFDPMNNYDWVKTDILLSNVLFSNSNKTKEGDIGNGIIDIFDRYNFTVKEDEPYEKEVAIDPELLGKAYEKFNAIRPDNFNEFVAALKSGKKGEESKFNKQYGVYYTPREIVHYMCQQSLINYLYSELNPKTVYQKFDNPQLDLLGNSAKEGQLDLMVEHRVDPEISKEDLALLVQNGENWRENEARVNEAGKETGTYYYKLPESIRMNAALIDNKLASVMVCDPAVGSGAFPVGMMSEIVKIRQVLEIFINNKRTNYEFKRECIENSLYGVDIDPGAIEIAKLRLWLSLVVDEDDPQNIKPLPNLDYKIVCGDSLNTIQKNLFNNDLFMKLEEIKPKYVEETSIAKKAEYKSQIERLISELTNGDRKFDFEIYFSEVFHKNQGFDVIIANPPYISVEKFARTSTQNYWKTRFKQTYASRGDIYCFFYQRGIEILHDYGTLAFISSNKFMRANYGEGLRKLLFSKTLHSVIDFGELPVFEASTDPCIVILSKKAFERKDETRIIVIKSEQDIYRLSKTVDAKGEYIKQSELSSSGWTLEGNIGLKLIEKLRIKGKPLEKYINKRMYYGIKTGYNEAFVIDKETKERLIAEDNKSKELIKPWLRGKDIKRWTFEYHDYYVIAFPFGFHNKLEQYPAISKHLKRFENALKARGQCKTSRDGSNEGQHHWLELDNNPSQEYLDRFAQNKLVFNETSKELHAFFDRNGYAINKTGFILLPEDPLYVLGILNSSTLDYLYRITFPSWGDSFKDGRIQFRGSLMNQIPIPQANDEQKGRVEEYVLACEQAAKNEDHNKIKYFETKINSIVYSLFDLSIEEIALIENATRNLDRSPEVETD